MRPAKALWPLDPAEMVSWQLGIDHCKVFICYTSGCKMRSAYAPPKALSLDYLFIFS